MGVIRVLDHVRHCYSNADGLVIQAVIKQQFDLGNKVVLSFEGVDSVSSSFINSAFIELLDFYDFEFIKKNLGFINSIKTINDTIKRRFSFEVNERNSFTYV